MKKRFVIYGLLANLLFFTYVHAESLLVQTHNINIVVDCVDEALEAIRGLGGHNLQMDMFTMDLHGMAPSRQAEITRRIDASEYRMAQELLRSLGTVTFESESARNVAGEISDLQLRIQAATGEFDRISHMLAESDTIDMLIALDSRLSEIAWRRDDLVGSLNLLTAESGSALLMINLAEDLGVFVPPPEPSFGERVSGSFFGSWNVVTSIAQGLAIFVAYAFIPAVLLSILFFPLRSAYRAVSRNREKLRILAWQRYYDAKTKTDPQAEIKPTNEEITHTEERLASTLPDESVTTDLANPASTENDDGEKSKLLEVQDV